MADGYILDSIKNALYYKITEGDESKIETHRQVKNMFGYCKNHGERIKNEDRDKYNRLYRVNI